MLPVGKQDRKERPVFEGVLAYFPDAISEVAYVSYVGNRQHNPGEPLHWDKNKSPDHRDCIARHLLESGTIDPSDGLRHSAKVAWRALAALQIELDNEAKLPPREEVIKAKLEEVFGAIDPAAPFHGTITPLIYGHTGTDAREAVVYPVCTQVPERTVSEEAERAAVMPPAATYYLAGPMRNYPDFNFPAFDAAKAHLEAKGYNVISPADMDRADPQPRGADPLPQYVYAHRDTQALITLAEDYDNFDLENGIYMLKGWQASKGACAEHALAQWLGLKIVYQEDE
jgi:hypothetical protein